MVIKAIGEEGGYIGGLDNGIVGPLVGGRPNNWRR